MLLCVRVLVLGLIIKWIEDDYLFVVWNFQFFKVKVKLDVLWDVFGIMINFFVVD